jgi:hypothetical protein
MSEFTPMQWVIVAVIVAAILYGANGLWNWIARLRSRGRPPDIPR